MILVAVVISFLIGAYGNAYLARQKYNSQITTLKETNSVLYQSYYSRGYSDGYEMGKADEHARQQNDITQIFMNHAEQ